MLGAVGALEGGFGRAARLHQHLGAGGAGAGLGERLLGHGGGCGFCHCEHMSFDEDRDMRIFSDEFA